jgi:hypothetical protein
MSIRRWRRTVIVSGIWLAGLVRPGHIGAQTPSHPSPRVVGFLLPSTLHGYVCQDSSPWISPAHTIHYGYADDSTNTVVVSMSHLRLDATQTSSLVMSHRFLQTQAKSYLDSLPLGVIHGAYDAYKIAYSQVSDMTIQQMSIPGYTLSVVVRRQGTVALRFVDWYAIQGWVIQVRATMPAAQMATSTLPLFIHDLVGQLVRQDTMVQPQQHRPSPP